MYKIKGGDGLEYGPLTAEQIGTWYAEGRLNMQTPVLADETTEWVSLANVSELAALAGAVAPPVAPVMMQQPPGPAYAPPTAQPYGTPFGTPTGQQYGAPVGQPFGQPTTPPNSWGTAQPPAYMGPTYPGAFAQAGYPVGFQPKSRLVGGLLGIFLGAWGVHRFYLGFVGIGIAQILVTICTFGIGALWGLIEGILILTGSMNTDANGYPLTE